MNRALTGFTSTIFAEMSALALATDSVNLGQGFPDFDGPQSVLDRARQAIAEGVNQYPPGPGSAVLRQAIADHQSRWYGVGLDPDHEVLVTAGATEAIAATMLGLLEPGDEVVMLEPYYDSYAAMVSLAGGVRCPVRLEPPSFALPRERLAAAIGPATRVLLLNSPHNPTGMVLSADDLGFVADLAQRHDLIVVTDEVYEHLTFDGVPHVPLCTLPGMAGRTLTISSAGKTFSVTGWKIGWVSGPAELVAAVRAAKQFLTYVNGAPFQPAVAEALALPDAYFEGFRASLQAKRDRLIDGLEGRGRRGVSAVRHLLRGGRRPQPGLCRRLRPVPGAARVVRRGRGAAVGVLRRPGRRAAPGAVRLLQARRGARRSRPPAAHAARLTRPRWPCG